MSEEIKNENMMKKVLIKKYQDSYDSRGNSTTHFKGFEVNENTQDLKEGYYSVCDLTGELTLIENEEGEEEEVMGSEDGYTYTEDYNYIQFIKSEEELKEMELLVELYNKHL